MKKSFAYYLQANLKTVAAFLVGHSIGTVVGYYFGTLEESSKLDTVSNLALGYLFFIAICTPLDYLWHTKMKVPFFRRFYKKTNNQ